MDARLIRTPSRDHVVSTCMRDTVSTTLAQIQHLASPVCRSCHVGNNTSNVWGWLALTRNTKLLQFDHTRYGLDENTLPWTVFADRGYLRACYDHNGVERPEWIGRHVSEHLPSIDPRYFGLLNYQIRANFEGQDLISYHFATTARIAAGINDSEASCDSSELLALGLVLEDVIQSFVERQCLHLAFDRWVGSTADRRIVSLPIRRITYPRANEMQIIDSNDRPVFVGTSKQLTDQLLDGAGQVYRRIAQGAELAKVGYPWFGLELSYLIQSVREFQIDPTQRRFWHAGGSSSQYYINRPEFRQRSRRVRDILASAGLLPADAALTIIPTFCCQLFATSAAGVEILDQIVALWRDYLDTNSRAMWRPLVSLARTIAPLAVGQRAHERADDDFLDSLRRLLTAFAAVDRNRLPVAHVAYLRHSQYNKFGAEQAAFLDLQPTFPRMFQELQWCEAELLVKIIAQIYADQPE